MKLAWSNIETLLNNLFQAYRTDSKSLGSFRGQVYRLYKGIESCAVPPKIRFKWMCYVTETAKNPRFGTRPWIQYKCLSKPGLQNSDDGTVPDDVTAITAFGSLLSGYAKKSRLQFAVKHADAGKKLHAKLSDVLCTISPKIVEWKVMSPEIGSVAVDSCVIYLAVSLDDPDVKSIAETLSSGLSAELRGDTEPLGLQKMAPGIFGLELPDADVARNKLKMHNTEIGSAGATIASILDMIAFNAVKGLETNSKAVEYATTNGLTEYLKIHADYVLKSVGWELA